MAIRRKVIHQGSIADTTRQCRDQWRSDGRHGRRVRPLVAGPAGKSGQVDLPIRVAVLDGENGPLFGIAKQPVMLPEGQPTTQFVFTNPACGIPGKLLGKGQDPGRF
jgi:hypothetical protein